MRTRILQATITAAAMAAMTVVFETPVSTHHSFAMYDQNKVVTLTGVMKQFVPQANHAELHFILLAPDHKALQKGADGKYVVKLVHRKLTREKVVSIRAGRRQLIEFNVNAP